MTNSPTNVEITCKNNYYGVFKIPIDELDKPIWIRLKVTIRSLEIEHKISQNSIELSWTDALRIIRELGSKKTQKKLKFRFKPIGDASIKLSEFLEQVQKIRNQRKYFTEIMSNEEIKIKLKEKGFSKRELKNFQLRDLSRLLSLNNGANFSVPGAGKTTVTFALHILTRTRESHLIVFSPKSAFQAWYDIVEECMDSNAPENGSEKFVKLSGSENDTKKMLNSGATRFIISYDLALRQQRVFFEHFQNNSVHLVLDESHHIKAGWKTQRGSFVMQIADQPIRRDILTGTPMPNSVTDLGSQLDFLWPGHGLGYELEHNSNKSPKEILGKLYVRTTKKELKLPKKNIIPVNVKMDPGQLALYSIARSEFIKSHSKTRAFRRQNQHFLVACKNIMRLLQLSVNPTLAISSIAADGIEIESGIVDQINNEGRSAKMRKVMQKVYELAKEGKKSVIWTIFKDSIYCLENSLIDLNPLVLHGGVKSGAVDDPDCREGIIHRFHNDGDCMVLIANPASAGEGINLHKICHNALYLDRNYVSTQYLQSIDRIHRLGLEENQETNIYIYYSVAPTEVGSIDMSVKRRLSKKIRNMEKLLDDSDLHEIALSEENAPEAIDYGIEPEDIIDLIEELEGKRVR